MIDENLQYDIKTEAAKISTLSFVITNKYEFLTGEKILPPDQSRMIKKLSLHLLFKEKLFENKQKQLKSKVKHKRRKTKEIEDDKKQHGNNELLVSEERQTFKNIYNKRLDKSDELSQKLIMST